MNTQKKWTKVLAVLLALAFLVPIANFAQAGQPGVTLKDHYIVVFEDGVNVDSSVPDLARAHGLNVSYTYRHALRGMAAYVPAGRLNGLQRDPRVAYVVEDMMRSVGEQTVPTGVRRIFADENANIDIDGTDDYRVDVDVAIIDTGIDLEHTDLNVVNSTSCLNSSGGGPPWAREYYCGEGGDDDHYHGTHVAGSVAALDNGFGVVGVAPGARLWAVKVCDAQGSCPSSAIIAGIDYVAANADSIEVANMSLGGSGYSQAEYDAIQGAVDNGVAFAVAAGNDDDDASNYSPAAFDNALTVSALADFDGEPGGLASPTCRDDQDDTLADFSNWGSAVDIAAPGVCILSTFPIEQGEYGTISGTSMASPHAAGGLALLASANNPSDATDVDNLYDQVINAGNFNWTDDSGDGIQEPLLDVGTFDPVLVPNGGNGNESPVASFTYACTDLSCSFDGSGSYDPDGSIASYAWDFGDGSTGSGATVSHTYAAGGTYTVVLTVTDDGGATGTDSQDVTVSESGGEGGGMYVWDISFRETGPHLKATVTIRVDSDGDGVAESADELVSNATVDFTFSNDSGQSQSYTGTTDSNGIVEFQWKRAPSGTYTAEVTGLTHSSYTWDSTLDADNPDYYTLQ